MDSNGNGRKGRWWHLPRRRSSIEEFLAPYRRVALQLHHDLPRPDHSRSALVVTASASPLSARVSLTLASCLAEELGRRVLVIDACPRRPELNLLLGTGESPGFADLLCEAECRFDDFVLPTTQENVFFLPAGRHRGFTIMGRREKFEELLRKAESEYEFLLIAGGPVLNETLPLVLTPSVGFVLLAIVENETTVDELEEAQEALHRNRPRNIGLILTTPIGRDLWPVRDAADALAGPESSETR
jgi:Mrp family chromosome partitioning ATPase